MLICEVRVYTSDPLVFTLHKKSRGRQLWDEILQVVPLAEPDYFSLQYTDDYNQKLWLDMNKPLGKQVKAMAGRDSVLFHLRVKIWPPDPSRIKDDLVRCLLVVQFQEGLLEKRILCSSQTMKRIGAYLLQSHLGEFHEERDKPGYSSQLRLVPDQRLVEAKIEALHRTTFCRGLSPSECDLRILELARRLDSYGLHTFNATDSAGCNIALAVSCEGILIFAGSARINKFPWAVLQKASFKDKVFFLELHSAKQEKPTKIGFKIKDRVSSREVWQLVVDLHAFYRWFNGLSDKKASEHHPVLKRHRSSLLIKTNASGIHPWSSLEKSRSLLRLVPAPPAKVQRECCRASSLRRRRVASEWRTCDSLSSFDSSSMERKSLQVDEEADFSKKSTEKDGGNDSDDLNSTSSGEDEGFGDGMYGGSMTPFSCDEIPDVDIEQVARRLSEEAENKIAPSAYYFVMCEIRDTERSYVNDLDILNVKFRSQVKETKILLPKQVSELFVNLDLIQEFHVNFLAELEARMSTWEGNAERFLKCDIGDIMKKRMACMKLYTSYVTNETKIFEMLAQWQSKSSEFARVCAQFEHSNVCHRPVSEFFYRPFQRMVHYKELLKRLFQKADSEYVDELEIKEALEYIEIALQHVNMSTKAAENARKMMRLQRELTGVDNLLRPGRVFIMEGTLLKLGVSGVKPKIFVLFNDILLYAVKRTVVHRSQLHTKKVMPLSELLIEDAAGQDHKWGFRITTSDGSFMVIASCTPEKELWLEALRRAMEGLGEGEGEETSLFDDIHHKRLSVATLEGDEAGQPNPSMTKCMACHARFGILKKKNHCKGCGRVVCSRCITRFHRLAFSDKPVRVCDECHLKEQRKLFGKRRGSAYWRQTAMLRHADEPAAESAGSCPPQIDCRLSDSSFSPDTSLSPRGGSISQDSASGLDQTTDAEAETLTCDVPSSNSLSLQSYLPSLPLGISRSSSLRLHTRPPLQRIKAMSGALSHFKTRSFDYQPLSRLALDKVLLSLEDKQFSSDRELSGYLIRKVRGKAGWKRFWLTVANKCFNLYKSHEDSHLLQSIPLPEFDMSLPDRADAEELQSTPTMPYVFKLYSADVAYYFLTENLYSLERWIEVLSSAVRKCHGRCAAKGRAFVKQRSQTIF